jgi:MFS family permease
VLLVAGSLGHLVVASCTGVAIFALRAALAIAQAGAFGGGMTFIARRTAPKQLAESFAMFGTSSFVGCLLGAPLGDLLVGSSPLDRAAVGRMFLAVAALAALSFPLAWAATRNETRPQRASGLPTWQLLLRYSPRMIFAVGVVVAMILQLPQAFLRTYAAGLDIPRVGLFFIVYSVAAIVARVLTRRWNERLGTRSVILVGSAILVTSQVSFLVVHAEWQLALPAALLGFAQAVLFPTITAAGSAAFPTGNRGLATTLGLATFDVGLLIGSPLAGVLLDGSHACGLPPYPTMFLAMAGIMAGVGVWYAVVTFRNSAAFIHVDRR